MIDSSFQKAKAAFKAAGVDLSGFTDEAVATKTMIPPISDVGQKVGAIWGPVLQRIFYGQTKGLPAIQKALTAARDATSHGLVLLPSGRYRLTRSLLVPPGVRVFGVGPTRPVLLLADKTPGFQDGVGTMVIFTGGDQYAVGDIPVPVPTARPVHANLPQNASTRGVKVAAGKFSTHCFPKRKSAIW